MDTISSGEEEENYMYMEYKVFVYKENDIDTYVAEKAFNKPSEIIDFLDDYVGYWVRFVELANLNIIIEGVYKP